ncbi:hypothetical protein SteCoe_3368 [Stentor coeruleus]|uniref:Vacuolar protein 14 C-terminal Fig4-binding domain-containing protein n=1 Tax=Stentor coeruleus TaxID=5963 RepID=A0A1R2CXC5_9CILI|nr:hypothetical protein SteCoe_3368 [Stentor coeruleus]
MSAFDRSASIVSVAEAQQIIPQQLEKHEIEKDFPKGLLQSLIEKNYEKRKQAGQNLQRFLKDQYAVKKSNDIIEKFISFFNDVYLLSVDDIYRQAGLMAYSAIVSSLNIKDDSKFIENLVNPVLSCCRDNNTKVKYYAVETLYNIIKVCRQNVLFMFPYLFKNIVDLCTGTDRDVKKASKKLDSLLKTIVVECEANEYLFSSVKFMELIKEMATGIGIPYVQRMIVAWITVLDSIPEFNLFLYLPNFFEGVFLMLRNSDPKLKNEAIIFLKDFLGEIKNDMSNSTLNLGYIMETIVHMVKINDSVVKREAITWISELIEKGEKRIIKYFPQAIKASLECLSDKDQRINEKAEQTNSKLQEYCKFFPQETSSDSGFELMSIVEVLMAYIDHESIKTRIAALEWVIILQIKDPEALEPSMEILVSTLSSRLSDSEPMVVNSTLVILCNIARYKEFFDKVISSILYEVSTNQAFSPDNVKKTVKTLCQGLGVELVYRSISELLNIEKSTSFCQKIIEVLNDLLLIDADFEEIRERLKYCIELEDMRCVEFFETLYKAWRFSPGCTLTLTFLVQAYNLAYEIINTMAKSNIDADLLQQLARLVQLIDSPVFVHLRMQMLEHQRHPYLLKSLYAILMVLPPSRAYKTLQHRLKDVSALHKSLPVKMEDEVRRGACIRNEELIQLFNQANSPKKIVMQKSDSKYSDKE